MTQPNAQDVLSVLSAPALVCTAAGAIVAMNQSAADWLGTSGIAAVGRPLGESLCTPSESLDAFLHRSQWRGHAICKGHVYHPANRSQRAAMVCHAQQLQGLQESGCLLLVFSHAAPRGVPELSASDSSTHEYSGTSVPCAEALSVWHAQGADANGMNALSEVALGLVHEVNQPLTAIATYAHSCRRWLSAGLTDNPKLLPTIDKIIEQVHVTGQMINSLKGLVRGHEDERQPYDLNQLVSESLELLSLDPRIERCLVESQLDSGPCPVLVSSVQIKIVLMNLLRNALEASLAVDVGESRLCVSVKAEEENWASATVSDSGEGIAQEMSEQLFQPFVTSKSNGLGLGLVISRCLANAHAGRIEYQPGVPRGASFQLRLPLAR